MSNTLLLSLLPRRKAQTFLDGIKLWVVWRQMQQGDVVGHAQRVAGLVPAGAIDRQHGMRAVRADLDQVQVHHLGVGERQYESGAGATGRADRANDVGPG